MRVIHELFDDRSVWALILINIFLGGLFAAINAHYTHFVGNFYIPQLWLWLSPILLGLYFFALFANAHAPRMANFTQSYTLYLFLLMSFAALATGVQYTPFQTIDHVLVYFDDFFDFSTPTLVEWTNQHLIIRAILNYAYDLLDIQVFFVPLLVSWLVRENILRQFFVMTGLGFLISCLVYYAFPTAAPSSVFTHIKFLPRVHLTAIKYYQIHHYLPLTVHDTSMIAFPSMHVVWAVAILYLVRHWWWLFVPLLIINTTVILATMLLGWHYLADVIAALAVMWLSIYAAQQLCPLQRRRNNASSV